jgi:hypothetical protein
MPRSSLGYLPTDAPDVANGSSVAAAGNTVFAGPIGFIKRSTTASTTLTAANVLGGLVDSSAGAATTLPTAAALVAAVPSADVGMSVTCHFRNTAGTALSFTGGSGTTLTDAGTLVSIPSEATGTLIFEFTNVTPGAEAVSAHSLVNADATS